MINTLIKKSGLAAMTLLASLAMSITATMAATTSPNTSNTLNTTDTNDRWIVKRHTQGDSKRAPLATGRKQIQRVRSEEDGFELYVGKADDDTLKKLRADPDVEYIVPDGWKHAHAIANDSLYSDQWYLQNIQPAAIAANLAWDATTGSNGTVVAVLDTGVRFDHPDLLRAEQGGKLLPGFDFVSGESTTSFLTANDGNGWDADASDPGDWISVDDLARTDKKFDKCGSGTNQDKPTESTWHGTRVAGLIAAASNNGIGIAGVSWGTYILPIRVLGKCGGRDSDIVQAMRWAAGLHVSGVPDNPYPAKIINMSLGSAPTAATSGCSPQYSSVITQLTQMGVLVVVSAGNEGGPVDEPANCLGALGVAGLRHIGTKVGYSSIGPEVSIATAAGNCVNQTGDCLFSLVTTNDSGIADPIGGTYTNHLNTANLGTSFSAPLAAGVAALMQSVNNKLTPAQLIKRMQQGSHAFPTGSVAACHVPTSSTDIQLNECTCTTSTCGAGMLYAPDAIAAAKKPIAYISANTAFSPGNTVMLNASGSAAACNHTLTAFSWTVLSASGTTSPSIANANQSIASVIAPISGSFIIRVTVTDDVGASDTSDIQVLSTNTVVTNDSPLVAESCPIAVSLASSSSSSASAAAAPSTGSKSGGGNFGWLSLATLLSLLMTRVSYRKTY